MPKDRHWQLSLLTRLNHEAAQTTVLTAEQRQQLARMLAELLLQAARLEDNSGEEVHDE
jgi:hypothetical protein